LQPVELAGNGQHRTTGGPVGEAPGRIYF
jgi:hypothetical protein